MDSIAAKQYASAIYQASSQSGKVEVVLNQMELLEELLKNSPEMTLFWKHPQIKPLAKLQAVQEVLNQPFLPETARFLMLILEKGRSGIVEEVLEQFRHLRLEELGVLVVKVSTAKALNEDEESRLIEKLKKEHGKDILLEKDIQPELLGGIRVQVEDTVYDSTIRRRLDKMREVLLPQFR
jgi:F-type H+-transporting ATPase subunit delta